MFKIKFLLILILLTSCHFTYTKSEKEVLFSSELIKQFSFEHIIDINKNYINKSSINRPVGTWVRLIETENICLDYRIASSTIDGELRLSEKNQKCQDLPVGEYISDLSSIRNLKIDFKTDTVEGKKVRNANYGLTFSYDYIGEKKVYAIPMFNLKRSKYFDKVKYEKYDSYATHRWQKGLRINPEGRVKIRTSSWIGSSKNDYIHKKINFCHRVDSSCNEVIENTCDECLNNWIEVVDYNCPTGSSKICAPLSCGQRGMPACPRGTFWKGITTMVDLCFTDSPAGYCDEGLSTICDENKILTCI
ncbi:hypothetical protein [Halobacteriovorax sp. HLS]|uniref:hypothetical protein n=1 Tax=Halobacteriovorax sp. HLS TaxID=2234000 RepID=UPI000FD7E20D|nr:hypothetical protein [Halobacteriovorax sp. HLS]